MCFAHPDRAHLSTTPLLHIRVRPNRHGKRRHPAAFPKWKNTQPRDCRALLDSDRKRQYTGFLAPKTAEPPKTKGEPWQGYKVCSAAYCNSVACRRNILLCGIRQVNTSAQILFQADCKQMQRSVGKD